MITSFGLAYSKGSGFTPFIQVAVFVKSISTSTRTTTVYEHDTDSFPQLSVDVHVTSVVPWFNETPSSED